MQYAYINPICYSLCMYARITPAIIIQYERGANFSAQCPHNNAPHDQRTLAQISRAKKMVAVRFELTRTYVQAVSPHHVTKVT
jgi:hypothetical protein